jgi:agmatinase
MLKTIPPRPASGTFLSFPLCTEIDSMEADFAILGIPYGDPYSMDEVTNDSTNAPSAIRLESARLSIGLDQWDFDQGGPLFSGQNIRVVDCGDVPGDPADIKGHYRIAETVVKTILSRNALPVVLLSNWDARPRQCPCKRS